MRTCRRRGDSGQVRRRGEDEGAVTFSEAQLLGHQAEERKATVGAENENIATSTGSVS